MSIVDVFFNIFYEFSLMIIICNTCIMIAFLSFVKCCIFYPICCKLLVPHLLLSVLLSVQSHNGNYNL